MGESLVEVGKESSGNDENEVVDVELYFIKYYKNDINCYGGNNGNEMLSWLF